MTPTGVSLLAAGASFMATGASLETPGTCFIPVPVRLAPASVLQSNIGAPHASGTRARMHAAILPFVASTKDPEPRDCVLRTVNASDRRADTPTDTR